MNTRFARTAFVALALGTIATSLGMACSVAGSRGNSSGNSGGDGGDTGQGGNGMGGNGTGGEINLTVGSGGGDPGPNGDPTTCAQASMYKTYIGCDFWPTVVANNVWSLFDFAVVVANAGDSPADVTVTRGGNTIATATVAPNDLAKLYLPWVPALKGPDFDECTSVTPITASIREPNGAYHLVSSKPVTVYQFNALEYGPQGGPPGKNWNSCLAPQCGIDCYSYSNDASLLLPSTAMTGNYRVTGQAGWPTAGLGSYFAITGTQDNTTVQVKVSGLGQILAGGGIPATGPNGLAEFSLNQGEVVEVMFDPSKDPSGSQIYADKPVQVIAGHPCTQMPLGTAACDHIEESVFPAETLGKRYFVTPPTSAGGNVVGHVVRIYGNVNGTVLTYPGNKPANAPLSVNAGQVFDLGVVSEPFEITGSNEFAVASFQLGAQAADPSGGRGDPAQSNVIAVEQYRIKYVFLAPSDYDVSFVDIIQPLTASVSIDGTTVAESPTPISSNYGVTRVKLGPGVNGAHVLSSTEAVGIQVVGYGSYTSYQYPGGLNLGVIAPPPPPPN